jgi:eukaryotic-like serine/threonine-protein kinase
MSMEALRRDRPRRGAPLDPIGRAARSTCALDTGTVAELWCLSRADAGLVKRLAELGTKGVGGFDIGYGYDDEGAFVVRRVPTRTLDGLAKGECLEGLTALAKVRDLARALAACEEKAIFPGPMRPLDVALSSEGRTEAWFVADAYVRALVGDLTPASSTSSGPSPRWTPPEQAGGAPWDNAANRYVLGLVAYRLIAGGHPFSGIGLREAMRAQASAPPPFDDAVARALRPGMQSLVLAMLDPEPAKRPPSAAAIVLRCEEILRGERAAAPRAAAAGVTSARGERAAAPRDASAAAAAPPPVAASASARSWSRLVLPGLPIVIGLVVAAVGLLSAGRRPADAEPAARVAVAARRPLERTTSEACAPCHARQVTEWQRSVMAHAVKSPLFGALESVVEEQVGRDARCPNGAGVLRRASGDVCRDEKTGFTVTGAGGEHWCVNCHSAGDNLASTVPAWSAQSFAGGAGSRVGEGARKPLRDLLSAGAMEGISCAVCHQTVGPVHASGAARAGDYEGNATWVSFTTGAVFRTRPEDATGVSGIGNSGYLLDPSSFVTRALGAGGPGDPIVHRRASPEASTYLASSEFCGACHDVRLFGTDSLGVRETGEHFKRLRNAYSEWRSWADTERASGRRAATCQDCHMSLYPGVCVVGASAGSGASAKDGCPTGFHFEARAPGEKARGMVASSSSEPRPITSHYFTSVDLPLSAEFDDRWAVDASLDASGSPVGLELRRLQMLRHTFEFGLGRGARVGARLEIPVEVRNAGAGHRVPAGFSQEREIWVELTVEDARGGVVYEVGKIADDDADLRDKVFVRVTTRDDNLDVKGRPQGVFGADVVDGPDVQRWSPNPVVGGTTFRGKGLINFQNGFLRCVKCIGVIDRDGACQAGPGQGRTRADRFDDGTYDLDTGECLSNLSGTNAFFETYFPVGALDADRGAAKAPDAILDTRSVPPGAQIRYTYEIETGGHPGPYVVKAKLRFRPFPPFLLRAFADYEARKAGAGLRPSGAQLTAPMLRRNHPIDLAEASATIE